MGNMVVRFALGDSLEKWWPPNYATKRHHWCIDISRKGGSYYCDDPEVGSDQFDPSFDYSVFGCRGAKCQTCLDMNPAFFPPRELWPGNSVFKKDPKSREIRFTWGALEQSKESGCESCGVLLEGMECVRGETAKFDSACVFRVEIREGFTVLVTQEKAPDEGRGIERNKFAVEFHGRADKETPWRAFGTADTVTSDIEVAEIFTFVQNRMDSCLKHSKCLSKEPSTVPTRVIDVGTGENDIRLEASPKAGVSYMTLSHCWGTSYLPRTTTINFEQHCENIAWSALTKTLQDAISVTRGLGIQYLWIDSLCIIQDSKTDWESEAKNMASIYTRSYLTLAATAAEDGSGGLLNSRYNVNEMDEAEDTQEYQINRRSQEGASDYSIFARRPIHYSHRYLLTLEYDVTHLQKAPLLSRAWVLQERLLSPRTLHFCFDELVWECKTGIECECGYGISASGRAEMDGLLGLNLFRELFTNLQLPDLRSSDETSHSDHEDFLFAWYQLIVYYTTLSITYPSDRLPALRGMTKYLEDTMGWTYIEGLWIHDFVRGALFSRDSNRVCLRRKDAPSWSWASIEVCDDWLPQNYFTFAFATNVKTSWEVDKGFRIIDHSARPDRTLPDADALENLILEGKSFIVMAAAFVNASIICEIVKSQEDAASSDQIETEMRLRVEGNDNAIRATWDIVVENENGCAEISEGNEVVAILLAHAVAEMSGHGLVLKRDSDDGLYRRVGYFSAPDSQGHFSGDDMKQLVLV